MLEECLIEFAAPVLAGLRTAAIFSCRFDGPEEEAARVAEMNALLNGRDLYLKVLSHRKGRAQVYFYRKGKLEQDLQKKGVADFLSRSGYSVCSPEEALRLLGERLDQKGDFPHELGIFLGYPLPDVIGFIEQGGKNCKCCEVWKVYSNENETKALFDRFRKCTEVYRKVFARGRTLAQLTVAA